MFLDIIGNIFMFVTIHLMIIFVLKSHIAIIKANLQYFDIQFFLTYNCGFLIIEYFLYLAYSKYILN